jgi:hypothetical protein
MHLGQGGDHPFCTPFRGAGAWILVACLSRSRSRVLCSGSRSSFWLSAGTWEFTSLLPVLSGFQRGFSCWEFGSGGYRSFASGGGSVTPPAATPSQFFSADLLCRRFCGWSHRQSDINDLPLPLGVSGPDRTDYSPVNPPGTMSSDKSLPGWGTHLDFDYGIWHWASMVSPPWRTQYALGMSRNPSVVAAIHRPHGTRSPSLYVFTAVFFCYIG